MRRRGRLVEAVDTQLYVAEVGPAAGYPVMVVHGGPGVDHHMFGDYLDPLAERGYRLLLVDQRGQGRSGPSYPKTWTLEKMAEDILSLARSLALERYAVLGHSYGAFVALQNAVDFPGMAAQTLVSSGVPSERYLDKVHENLASFEPVELREQVTRSWEKEATVSTPKELGELLGEQLPFHFADPLDPRIEEYQRRTAGGKYSPEVLRTFANSGYGAIDVQDRLGDIRQPVLILAGRHDRTCSVEAAEDMAKGIPNSELVIFENSGHMTFAEENEGYVDVVDGFLEKHDGMGITR